MEKIIRFSDADMETLFDHFDTDNSGVLEPNEVEKMLKLINMPMTEDERKSFMDELDTNDDGNVELEEFKDWILDV